MKLGVSEHKSKESNREKLKKEMFKQFNLVCATAMQSQLLSFAEFFLSAVLFQTDVRTFYNTMPVCQNFIFYL